MSYTRPHSGKFENRPQVGKYITRLYVGKYITHDEIIIKYEKEIKKRGLVYDQDQLKDNYSIEYDIFNDVSYKFKADCLLSNYNYSTRRILNRNGKTYKDKVEELKKEFNVELDQYSLYLDKYIELSKQDYIKLKYTGFIEETKKISTEIYNELLYDANIYNKKIEEKNLFAINENKIIDFENMKLSSSCSSKVMYNNKMYYSICSRSDCKVPNCNYVNHKHDLRNLYNGNNFVEEYICNICMGVF